jgi:hypothetical protein
VCMKILQSTCEIYARKMGMSRVRLNEKKFSICGIEFGCVNITKTIKFTCPFMFFIRSRKEIGNGEKGDRKISPLNKLDLWFI